MDNNNNYLLKSPFFIFMDETYFVRMFSNDFLKHLPDCIIVSLIGIDCQQYTDVFYECPGINHSISTIKISFIIFIKIYKINIM